MPPKDGVDTLLGGPKSRPGQDRRPFQLGACHQLHEQAGVGMVDQTSNRDCLSATCWPRRLKPSAAWGDWENDGMDCRVSLCEHFKICTDRA